ncbi:MAG: hypothetical protein ACNA78_09720 [Balneolaceae bacterium]
MKYNIEFLRFLAVILITLTHTRHDVTDGWLFLLVYHIPQYGTVILSIISGYLYWNFTRKNRTLIQRKVKSLLYPFLIANILVVIPVLAFYYLLDINFLNRLSFDYTLLTEGILALSVAPINPPTFFIRDIFVVFVLIEFAFRKNLYMLLIILPLLFFGELMIRYDILVMFICGAAFAAMDITKYRTPLIAGALVLTALSAYFAPDYTKFFASLLLFLLIIDIQIKFYDVGAYSYLLHLYHSPMIVVTYPILSRFVTHELVSIIFQVAISLAGSYLLYRITRRVRVLRILSGNR